MRATIICALLLVSPGESLAGQSPIGRSGWALHRHHHPGRVQAGTSSEASVLQATGLIRPNGAHLALPSTAAGRVATSPPTTCNTQNSGSQQCYTATQQTRSR